MKKILIVGATSAIAAATARRWAEQGCALYLLGRDAERLDAAVADLQQRGAGAAHRAVLDANAVDEHVASIDEAFRVLDGLDVALIAYGTLPDQAACNIDFAVAQQQFHTNAISVMSLLTELANRLAAQGSGTLAVIGSVAGDRGRQSNYVYGAAKGAVAIFLQGLRQRLAKSGVHVLTIKPGFVDTPMTAQFKKGPLWAQPDAIAADIIAAVDRRKDVLYTPWFWRFMMLAIKMIPERFFKKISL